MAVSALIYKRGQDPKRKIYKSIFTQRYLLIAHFQKQSFRIHTSVYDVFAIKCCLVFNHQWRKQMASLADYLLTYSIKTSKFRITPREKEEAQKKAKAVRDAIADIDHLDWEKVEDVETTFKGSFLMETISPPMKRLKAEEIVTNKFKSILKQEDASHYWVSITCQMMVEDAGESFSFVVYT